MCSEIRERPGMGSIKIVFKPVEEGSAALTDDRRWQGKEFDGEHGKYYFGARYFDPFFGMWISPDPAGQFANPYSYGGDPLNYIDPTACGLSAWALSSVTTNPMGGASASVWQRNLKSSA